MRKKRLTTQKMAMIGVMAAFYVVLSLYVAAIKLGNVKITFASVPTILMATLFGPLEGMLTAAIGSFICQMISYGFTATTVLSAGFQSLYGRIYGKGNFKRRQKAGRPQDTVPGLYRGGGCYNHRRKHVCHLGRQRYLRILYIRLCIRSDSGQIYYGYCHCRRRFAYNNDGNQTTEKSCIQMKNTCLYIACDIVL